MPPKTAWEWLEGYGNMNMKEEDVPKFLRTPEFLKLLRDNCILKDGSEEEKRATFEEEKAEGEFINDYGKFFYSISCNFSYSDEGENYD